MALAPVDIVASLLSSEQGSALHFMLDGYPYINRASGDVRRTLESMLATVVRHEGELANVVEQLGQGPRMAAVNTEEQYLAFLSVEFLIPRLIEDRKRAIIRYDKAISLLQPVSPRICALLQSHLNDHRTHLAQLERALVPQPLVPAHTA